MCPVINRLPKKPRLTEKSESRTERHKYYDTVRWRKLRIQKLMEQPLCEKCLEVDTVTPAVDIHHLISFMSVDNPNQRTALFYDYNNLQSLCKDCHATIHNKQNH